MYISRIAEQQVQQLLHSSKVLIILGARQVGKTTLVQHLMSTKRSMMLNFDIDVDRDRFFAAASLSPHEALKSFGNPEVLVLDEVQRKPETSRVVKGWYDAGLPVKVLLLGSSSLDILHQSAESLTGRNEKIILPPLVFQEIVQYQPWYTNALSLVQLEQQFSNQIQPLLLQCLITGSYPEAVLTPPKETYLLNLVSDFLLKDILQLGLVKTPDLIKRLLSLLAYQAGAEVSLNELATNLSIARATVERYIDLLEQTFVIFRLPALSSNPRKEINKSQKIYFWDTGIRNALLKEFSLNPLRADIGALWENFVIAEFAKHNLLTGQRQNLYFWRSRAGSEVDLVVKRGNEMSAYEIKWQPQRITTRAFEAQYHTSVRLVDRTHPLSFLQNL